ncbi:hypothetical protein LCGC14_0561360 [marine sediment metagenome]|uniref:Uncharacterized protein n=1 Tax=marine sediment metagenome TaxID=412755 RepID=A0A0F9RS25_9ZZZZ
MKPQMVLELQTFPASHVGLNKYRKEILRVGHYIKDSTGQEFDITRKTLEHLIETFGVWVGNGNKVSVPLGHERAGLPEANKGWVESLFREGDSLFAIMELSDPELALTTDVSVCIVSEFVDGKGIKYKNVLTHVALTTSPVVGGLDNFMKLSLSIGETSMDFLKKLAEKLGLAKDTEPTEDAIIMALEAHKKVEKVVTKSAEVIDPLVKLVSEGRALKLAQLVKAGLLTPAVKEVIETKFVKIDVVALSLANKVDDGFDILCEILVSNRPAKLGEVTGIQSVELANKGLETPNAMELSVAKARKEAGLKD